jgi:GT2 family glycosyltransferase
MKIAFICVNYNNSKVTIEYILNVLEIKQNFDVKIIIVDNASHETDILELEKFILDLNNNDVVLIKSIENLGYFKGLNLGINFVDKVEYDYVVIGNNDLNFNVNFINELTNVKFDSSIFVIAPNIIKPDGSHQNPHILIKFTLIKKLYRRLYYSNYYVSVALQLIMNLKAGLSKSYDREGNDKESVILMGYGACYILTRNFFNNFNCLDAPNFLMGEEGVLANQVLSRNGQTLYKPDLIVYHHDHTSIGKLPSRSLFEYNRIAYYHFIKECTYVH